MKNRTVRGQSRIFLVLPTDLTISEDEILSSFSDVKTIFKMRLYWDSDCISNVKDTQRPFFFYSVIQIQLTVK